MEPAPTHAFQSLKIKYRLKHLAELVPELPCISASYTYERNKDSHSLCMPRLKSVLCRTESNDWERAYVLARSSDKLQLR